MILKWRKGRTRWGDPCTFLVAEDGQAVAVVRDPSPDAYLPMYHYHCEMMVGDKGCGDNLASASKRDCQERARQHQREAH